VSIAAMSPHWKIPGETFDPAPDVITALKGNDLDKLADTLAPPHPAYQKLVKALATYKDLAARSGWAEIPGDKEVKLDGADPRVALVAERLKAEGYDVTDLPAALALFQTRHGLKPDGRVGKGTLAELNISAADRATQIAVNLERWRHLPRDFGTDYVAVNTADATVALYRDGKPVLNLRAITGDRRHATPVLMSRITAVTFNPPWEIPPSIANKEILPKLKKDPTYLAANNMVVVDGSLTDPSGTFTNWMQYDGKPLPFRFRQRPGAANSLGDLKFEMQNPYNIYLHDTPSRALFNKDDRHLSHGCVRVENPRELALALLSFTPLWDMDAIESAINARRTTRTAIKPSVPVYVLYFTALVDDAGNATFRDDAYGRDPSIAEALSRPLAQSRAAGGQSSAREE
jgi:murein L,D-transpeptidase YcbB/YkuD